MSYEQSVTLHQQSGGISVQAFADIEGLTLKQAFYCIKRGKVLGARQDARSKRWFVYPPAKLLERPRTRKAVAELPDLLVGADAVAVEAGVESRQSGQCAPLVKPEGIRPPAGQQAPQGRAEGCRWRSAVRRREAFCASCTRLLQGSSAKGCIICVWIRTRLRSSMPLWTTTAAVSARWSAKG